LAVNLRFRFSGVQGQYNAKKKLRLFSLLGGQMPILFSFMLLINTLFMYIKFNMFQRQK
jgi:hypothetical protein